MEISICVTTVCNLYCRYCYQGHDKKNVSMAKGTALEVAKKILNLLKLSNDQILKINYIGGEPLLNSEAIFMICEYIQGQIDEQNVDVEYSMTTNGLLLTNNIVKELEKLKFKVSLSIDGDIDSNDSNRIMRNGLGTYTQVIEGFKKFTHPEEICARMTITKQEMNKLVKNVEHLYNIGFRKILPACNFYGEWNEEDFLRMQKNHGLLKEWYLEKYPKVSLSCFEGRFYDYYFRKGKFCKAGFPYHYSFGVDGNLYPCTYVNHKKEFLIQCDKEIPSIDNNIIEKYVKKDEKCFDCEIKRFCFGRKCGFLNLDITGSLTIVPMSICRYEKMIYKLSEEIISELINKKDIRIKQFEQLGKAKENEL